MRNFLKILSLIITSSYIFVSCLSLDINVEENVANFIGHWQLYKMAKIDSAHNITEIKITNNDINEIIIGNNNTFTGILYFIDSINPHMSGRWEKTDKDVLSLIPDKIRDRENESNVLMLYKKDGFCVLDYKTFYQNDTVNVFIFNKQ